VVSLIISLSLLNWDYQRKTNGTYWKCGLLNAEEKLGSFIRHTDNCLSSLKGQWIGSPVFSIAPGGLWSWSSWYTWIHTTSDKVHETAFKQSRRQHLQPSLPNMMWNKAQTWLRKLAARWSRGMPRRHRNGN